MTPSGTTRARPQWALLALLGGCAIFATPAPPEVTTDTPVGDSGADEADTDTDTDSDADTDADTDTDTDTDTDVDTGEPFDCAYPASTGAPGDGCVSRGIDCGDTIVGTTEGGASNFDRGEYLGWFCTSSPNGDYSGSERVYAFTHPGTGTATFSLKSPCDELDLAVVRWEYWETEGYCPTDSNSIGECDMDDSSGDGELSVWQSREAYYLVVVDGPDAEEALFELSVACE
jgi:hypothetical protein